MLFCGSVSVVGPSWLVAVGSVAVGSREAGVDIASSGDTMRTVGDGTVGLAAADGGLAAVMEELSAVDGLAVGLCHGGFQNTGSQGVPCW